MAMLLPLGSAWAEEVRGPHVSVMGESIYVSTKLVLDEKRLAEIQKGVPKQIIYYIDLFREWDNWPDEFVTGRRITHNIHCDQLRGEFHLTTSDGMKEESARLKDCAAAIEAISSIARIHLTNVAELEPADYFVEVSVESRLRRLPPFINLLFFFVKEEEFRVTGRSPSFPIKLEQ